MLITLLFFGCSKATAPREEAIRPVRVIRLADQVDVPVITLPGEVRPRVESRVGFRVAGKIARRLVQAGDTVRKGQLLAQLDPQDLAPAIESALANIETASADLRLAVAERDRVQALRAKDFVSQAQVDRAQAQMDAAQGRLRSAQAALASARNSVEFQSLLADVDGVVISVEAEPGQVVMPGQSVIRIARGSERDIVVSVPETSLRSVNRATNLVITSPTLTGERLLGRIRESSPVADSASRTYLVKIEPSPQRSADRLPLGASATVSFELPASPGVLVPLSALHSSDADPKIWVVDEATLTVRAVSVQIAKEGLRDNGVLLSVTDASGLGRGQLVVTAGANLLREGQKIRLPSSSASSGAHAAIASPAAPAASNSSAPRP